MTPLSLNWTIQQPAADGDLELTYSLTNTGSSPLWVLDQLVVFGAENGFSLAPGRAAVQGGEDGMILVSLGYVPSDGQVMVPLRPVARRLAPAAKVNRTLHLPMPLTAWHPRGGAGEKLGPASLICLQIGYLDFDAPTNTWSLDGGGSIQVPARSALAAQRWLRGEVHTLP